MKTSAWQYLIGSVIVLLLCMQGAFAQSAPIRIVVFGDSITYGYQLDPNAAFPVMLERKLRSAGYQVKVINKSLPGETTAGALKRMGEVMAESPDIVILQLGINDGLKGIDVNKVIYPNLNKMIEAFKAKEIGVLVAGMRGQSSMNKKYAKEFEKMYYTAARYYRTSYYHDMLKGVTGRSSLTLADSFHPNEKGTLTMVHNFYPALEPLVKWRVKYLKYKVSNI